MYATGLNAIASARVNIAWYQQRAPEFAAFFETGYVEQEIEPVEGGEGDGGNGEGEEEGSGDGETDTGEGEGGEETDSANIAALSVITLIATLCINFLA